MREAGITEQGILERDVVGLLYTFNLELADIADIAFFVHMGFHFNLV